MKTKTKVIIGIVIAIIIGIVAGIIIYNNSDSVKLKKQLDLGNKLLAEEDYDKAIAAFELALQIDPRNADAYNGLADAYIALEDYQSAYDVLMEGYDRTDDEDLLERANKIEEEYLSKKQTEVEDASAIEEVPIESATTTEPSTNPDDAMLRRLYVAMKAEDFSKVVDMYNDSSYGRALEKVSYWQEPGEEYGIKYLCSSSSDKFFYFYFGPIQNGECAGEGYMFRTRKADGSYGTFKVFRGVFSSDLPNGEFECTTKSISNDDETILKGTLANGLWDGKTYRINDSGVWLEGPSFNNGTIILDGVHAVYKYNTITTTWKSDKFSVMYNLGGEPNPDTALFGAYGNCTQDCF